ncbi:MAG: glycine/sarcosine/betaine reductase selenoprotein B family protein [Desulfuromonadales bacterium]|jgi:D-proline reductase (dithiol) PrdB
MLNRFKNQLIAKVITRFPGLAKRFIDAYEPWASGEPTPWTPVTKPLSECRVALVTTSGVHHRGQQPFDMQDSEGDPSIREIDGTTIGDDYLITHDYYDHSDAEKDLNIILPVDRLRELQSEGGIGSLAPRHYSLMGHIDGRHIATLIGESAGKIIAGLRQDAVDVVLLTPA